MVLTTAEPTSEIWIGKINGVCIPFRIWKGITRSGAHIELYVLSITPNTKGDADVLAGELPEFMGRSKNLPLKIEEASRAEWLHFTGTEGPHGG